MNENIKKVVARSTEMYFLYLLYKNKLISEEECEEIKKYL